VRYGEVVSTRVVEIEGEATVLGRLGGAWIGYSLGMGEASVLTGARRVRSSFGGVAGTVAGEAIERRIKTEDGLEIVVRLGQDETIAVVQAMDIELRPGDRVRVVFGRDGSTRVQPL
jgi:outer membrane lipoprotein SlyB